MEDWKTTQNRFVSYADKYYVISERKEKAHWVQNIVHKSSVIFAVNSKSFEGTARIVDKHTEYKLAEEVSSLMRTKYGWKDGLIVELTPYKEQVEQKYIDASTLHDEIVQK